MSKFKVGQEVRVIGKYDGLNIDKSTITKIKYNDIHHCEAHYLSDETISEKDGQIYWFKEDELELAQQQPSAHPLVISRDLLNSKILSYIEGIQQTFKYKNNNYGADDDPLFNFRSAASNVLGEETADNMYKTLQIYVQKHLAALYKNGLGDPEFIERCKDVIVYSLISMAMKEIYDEQEGN